MSGIKPLGSNNDVIGEGKFLLVNFDNKMLPQTFRSSELLSTAKEMGKQSVKDSQG